MTCPRPLLAAATLVLALHAAASRGQEAPVLAPDAQPGGPPAEGLQVRLGAGALALPDYPGSKDYRAQPLPYVDARYGDWAALSYQDGLTINAVRLGGFTAGPMARVRFGRDEKDDRRALRGLGDVGPSVELGGFAAYEAGPVGVRAVVGQDVAGGSKGAIAELGATVTQAVFGTSAGPWLLAAGPVLTFVDSRYNRSYFGITRSQSILSGRPRYRPGGGAEGMGLAATLIVPVTEKIAVTALFGYDRLLSDAARSPIVRGGAGSPDQFTAGLFLTYQLR